MDRTVVALATAARGSGRWQVQALRGQLRPDCVPHSLGGCPCAATGLAGGSPRVTERDPIDDSAAIREAAA